jgi:prephenate dehydrogenase
MKIETIGIVGYGHFGQFLHDLIKRFLPEVEVKVYSEGEVCQCATTSLEVVAHCDFVFLAVPISQYELVIKQIKPYLGDKTILVDIATVKNHTVELFRTQLANQRWLSCHPMFGAESYQKTNGNVDGFRIVVCEKNLDGELYKKAFDFMTSLGFVVINLRAEEHDKLLADTLFMTHYIGQTMNRAGFGRTNIDTVSFQSLMNAVESVAQDGKLFADVYKYNPYCKEAAMRFHEAQQKVLDGLLKL